MKTIEQRIAEHMMNGADAEAKFSEISELVCYQLQLILEIERLSDQFRTRLFEQVINHRKELNQLISRFERPKEVAF